MRILLHSYQTNYDTKKNKLAYSPDNKDIFLKKMYFF